ncbi:MAG: DUF4331 family protein [Ignavibacteriae bacterium]|nr:DUF4331 family protein [Ignavibacteria bacterium]MBI3364035.1 DUF4331 family protein [Ignavibacteriota bacterium]
MKKFLLVAGLSICLVVLALVGVTRQTDASSHREAPLISSDPLADNTDLYVFRSPDDTNMVTIIANYIPLELPEGGPNYTTFGENIHYEIHIKNQTHTGALGSAKDDITYRFTFYQTNEDLTTFFNIRLGKQNLKTTYQCEKSTDGGAPWTTIITANQGIVPPNNIGPRSIEGGAGMNSSYSTLVNNAIVTASGGEKVFCGPRDDPFFVDLGGIFDLGQTRNKFGADPSNSDNARDGVAGFNTHAIIMNIPIASLQKDGKDASQATSILDPTFVIGVWASASRPQITTLSTNGDKPSVSGPWVQVSRLGMPLTNEAIIPVGQKDRWNYVSPYDSAEQSFVDYFSNPELALYMDTSKFAAAVPALDSLLIQAKSYPAIGVIPGYSTPGFNFLNGNDGAWAVTKLNPVPDLSGTAFAAGVTPALVDSGKPRRVDIYPVFYFGVPNLIPYQLATGKTGGPLSAGKPFIHNFLPITNDGGKLYGGDMLRLNMATPVTPRNTSEYTNNARMGLIRAAVLGLVAAPYNTSTNVEAIPHMDGFPNGRRLEDDVTTIELQAVGGLVLAAVGLPFDDATAGDYSNLASPRLFSHLNYIAGPTKNDLANSFTFPYVPDPHRGYGYVKQLTASGPSGVTAVGNDPLGMTVPRAFFLEQNYPNPFNPSTEIKYHVSTNEFVQLKIFNEVGQEIATLVGEQQTPGTYTAKWNAGNAASGVYFYRLQAGNTIVSTRKAMLVK